MSEEKINTNYDLPKEGTYNMYVESLTKKQSKNNPNVFYYILQTTIELEPNISSTVSFFYFKNQMGELLVALGAKEDPEEKGVYAMDPDDAAGKWITARLYLEKDNNGIVRPKLANIIPYIFEERPLKNTTWDEEEETKEDSPNL